MTHPTDSNNELAVSQDQTNKLDRIFTDLTPGFKFIIGIAFLVVAIVYSIWPIDIIPDILGPIGWIDDILVWGIVVITNGLLLLKGANRSVRSTTHDTGEKDRFI